MRLDAAAVLLQWATGGLVFLWVTTRRREVGLGYGWLMRATFGLMALGAFGVGRLIGWSWGRDLASLGVFGASMVALVVSVQRRRVGVRDADRETADIRHIRAHPLHFFHRELERQADPIGTRRGHGIEGVGQGDDARRKRDFLLFGKLHVCTYICIVKLEQAIQSVNFRNQNHRAAIARSVRSCDQ